MQYQIKPITLLIDLLSQIDHSTYIRVCQNKRIVYEGTVQEYMKEFRIIDTQAVKKVSFFDKYIIIKLEEK